MEWRERLEKRGEEDLPKRGPDWTREMEQWLATVRLDGLQLSAKSGGVN